MRTALDGNTFDLGTILLPPQQMAVYLCGMKDALNFTRVTAKDIKIRSSLGTAYLSHLDFFQCFLSPDFQPGAIQAGLIFEGPHRCQKLQ